MTCTAAHEPPAALPFLMRPQLNGIADIANDEWIDRLPGGTADDQDAFDKLCAEWEAKTNDFLDTTDSPIELHLFVELWNWDCGATAIERVATHEACEAATALMMYWRSRPEYYLQYESLDEMPEHERAGYQLVHLLEERYAQGAYRVGSLDYDPRAEGDLDAYEKAVKKGDRKLPEAMCRPARQS